MDDPICYELRDNACPHVAKTVQDFCSTQHMQLLPWPDYSPDISPIEHVWDLVSRRLARFIHELAALRPRKASAPRSLCVQMRYSLHYHNSINLFKDLS
ncbi:hypothetical protein TNCV_699411 [Trichonephila clavipes]|nr:hypothetical protein TNCV_699411 [Trichonephila clavipes]